jgi:phage terminase small subunit
MPALKNPRREWFAQELALGASAGIAYRRAGYVLRGRAAEAGAARLASSAEVTRRVGELTAGNAAPAEGASSDVTVATIIRELEEARRLAMAKKQPAPAVSAALGKAKIAGLVVDKAESRTDSTPAVEYTDTEAARRIAFLLRLAEIDPSDEKEP